MSGILPTSRFCHSFREFACEEPKRTDGARSVLLLIYAFVREPITAVVWRDRLDP